MKKRLFPYLAPAFALAFFISGASADTLCLKSTLKKGRIKNVSKTVSGNAKCPKGFAALISSPSLTLDSNSTLTIKGEQGPQGLQGLQGIQGVQGIQGPPGPKGQSGVAGLTIAYKQSDLVDSTSPKSVQVECPLGSSVIGGYGGVYDALGIPANLPVAMSFSSILFFSNQYAIRAYETTPIPDTWYLYVFALCRPNNA